MYSSGFAIGLMMSVTAVVCISSGVPGAGPGGNQGGAVGACCGGEPHQDHDRGAS